MLAYLLGVIVLIYGIVSEHVLACIGFCFCCCVVGMAIRSKKKKSESEGSVSNLSDPPKPAPKLSNPSPKASSKESSYESVNGGNSELSVRKDEIGEYSPVIPVPPSQISSVTIRTDEATSKKNGDIIEYLKSERKAIYFVHFTPVDNVDGILRYGLCPRTTQPVKGHWTDQIRIDGYVDCNCLSISFPNYQMLYKKTLERTYSYVILRISIEAIEYIDRKDIAFFPNNAASFGLIGTFNSHIGLPAARDMFLDTAVYGSKKATRNDLGIPSYYTTYPQAEVLVRSTIPACYIKQILVPQASMRDRVIDACRTNGMDIPVRVDYSLFRPRCDWQFWRITSANYSS